MNIEKEVRFKIDDENINKILGVSEPYLEEVETLDLTFGYEGFNSLATYGFVCRVRQKKNKIVIEIKKKIEEGWLEQEIKIESIEEGVNFFKMINMQPYMYLKRKREVRKYKGLKIFIDKVDLLGNFVEIEYQDSKNSTLEMNEFKKLAGISGKEQPLYGDIFKELFEKDKVFLNRFNEGLEKIIKNSILEDLDMKLENVLIEKAKEDGIEKLVVGGIITDKDNKYLIMRRNASDFMGGIDEIPSGKVEKGEGLFEALIREVKEETNLDVEKFLGYIDYFDYLSSSGKKSRQYNFYVKVKEGGEVKLTEHDEFHWLTIDECNTNKNITPKTLTTINIAEYNYRKK